MKWRSRSTLGIAFASLAILCSLGIIISLIVFLQQDNYHRYMQNIFVFFIAVCVLLVVTSSLLIIGILKRRHKLMIAGLVFHGTCYAFICFIFAYVVMQIVSGGVPARFTVPIFCVGLLVSYSWGFILWRIFTLYRDIRKENVTNPIKLDAITNNPMQLNYKI